MTEHNADLVAFVRARLDDEERLAEAAGGAGWHHPPGSSGEVHDSLGAIAFSVRTRGFDEHIARQDPARTLRRIGSSRVLLDQYVPLAGLDVDSPASDYASGRAVGLGFAVRQLAAEHADHPDYRASWLPRFT
ncbi:DUF6221 family protein [Streptomyces liangshanensis]|uniref:Uncharacterized protein n=1 Tax=Streptomyces liangshanensis TaxID=2717324 RepID=A0A6G9GRV1_9ACTN|nr:DUF6221 family protein [Streptomyces liangshanensis]QIQ00972.1 hypothetical protein HA039_00480 [Streptomyces liangshanensis]